MTLAAYFAVEMGLLAGAGLAIALLALAVGQLAVQMLCFLDLGFGTGSGWRMGTFVMTIGLVLVIVAGSIWIMVHLDYNMMASPEKMNGYIESQQGF